jgi:Protein of unknown function (DUF4233)
MRVLGSAVLVMEFFIMGFAMLLAKDNHEPSTILGSILQLLMIGYAVVVPSMAIVGLIFGGLWIAAIIVGRKGEAARAALMATRTPDA